MLKMTEFQYESLKDVAGSNLLTYMLVKPNALLDSPEVFAKWTTSNLETDALVEAGLLDDVSTDFSNAITENAHSTGRIFRVFKITDAGKAMFSEGHSGAIN